MWDKDIVDLLIIKYKEHENLYNARNPMYADRVKRSQSLDEICRKLKELKNNITVEDIKKKIHTLRSQYIKESRAIAYCKRKDAIAEVYKPKLWCFENLMFLEPHVLLRKVKSNGSEWNDSNTDYDVSTDAQSDPPVHIRCDNRINKCDEIDIEEISIEEKIEPVSQHCCSKRVSSNKRKSILDEQIDNVKRLLVKRLEKRNDYDWLGKQVVFEINSIQNRKIQKDTAWKIQTILREASIEDEAMSECQSEQISRELQSDTQSSCGSCSSNKQQIRSSISPVIKQSDSMDNSITYSLNPVHRLHPVCLIPAKSSDTSTPCLSSPSILQQALDGL